MPGVTLNCQGPPQEMIHRQWQQQGYEPSFLGQQFDVPRAVLREILYCLCLAGVQELSCKIRRKLESRGGGGGGVPEWLLHLGLKPPGGGKSNLKDKISYSPQRLLITQMHKQIVTPPHPPPPPQDSSFRRILQDNSWTPARQRQ